MNSLELCSQEEQGSRVMGELGIQTLMLCLVRGVCKGSWREALSVGMSVKVNRAVLN